MKPREALADLPPRRLLEHALRLLARQHGGDEATASAAREAFARWRAADPRHEAAAQLALRGWAATQATELQGAIPLPPRAASRVRTRRRALTLLGVAGLGAALFATGRWYVAQPVEQLALQTGHGQLLARTLADGSRIDLGPRTTARVLLFRDRREVRLQEGEARFDVTPDADRPFVVHTDWGWVRVLGTGFTVSARDRRMTVAVAHGRVAVHDSSAGRTGEPPADAVLGAGQAVQVDAHGVGDIGPVNTADVGAWREGWLVFDRTPLPEVLARWNDYLVRPVRLGDEAALRELRLTVSFVLRDPGSFFSSLPQVLPVRVERDGAGQQVVRLRR